MGILLGAGFYRGLVLRRVNRRRHRPGPARQSVGRQCALLDPVRQSRRCLAASLVRRGVRIDGTLRASTSGSLPKCPPYRSTNVVVEHRLDQTPDDAEPQSLCPAPAPMDDDSPALIRLLASPAAPASRPGAILGLLLLTAFVLWIAARAVRRMHISYGADI
jgi:hypothetical protein